MFVAEERLLRKIPADIFIFYFIEVMRDPTCLLIIWPSPPPITI